MMTLRLNQDLINLNDVPRHLPGQATPQTVKRWAREGCCGVKLRTMKVGHSRYTTLTALEEFCRAVSESCDRATTETNTENAVPTETPPDFPVHR